MNKTIFTLIVLLVTLVSKGQVFRDKTLYHDSDIHWVETKHYNGVDKRAYRTVDVVDTAGRTIGRKEFSKNKLFRKTEYLYNTNGDLVRTISFDYLNSFRVDTIINEYQYRNGRIAVQKEIPSYGDSTIYKLVDDNDSGLTYQRILYHYLPDRKLNNRVVETYTFTYDNNLLTNQKNINSDSSTVVTKYEYYNNGKLKRRIIERLYKNKPRIIGMYVGGPASDDQSYSYSYDKNDRVTEDFTTVNGKTYKIASYHYK